MTLPWHPLANLFPLIEGGDYQILVDDVRANGLREPIILLEGMILDGRNRARACEDAQVSPRYEPFAGKPDQAVTYVLSKNLARRHLNDAQRAWIASRLCGDEPPFGGLLAKEAAERLHVKLRSVERAAAIRKTGVPEVRAIVESGDLPIATAAGIASLTPEEQAELIRQARGATGPIARRALTLMKQRLRDRRENEKGRKQLADPRGVAGLIVEDFEWDHQTWSEAGKDSRHPSNHYQTSADAHTAEEIVRRTAGRFASAADDCVLWMWTTMPHLAIAIDVMRLRGFAYKSHYIWNKPHVITGYWSRARHEILLIGVKGKIDCPAMGTQSESVIDAPLGRHSAKPDAIMQMIERYFPTLPKLELNCRKRRPGWQGWGDEVEPAPDWRIAYERQAIERGLIDENWMVRTSRTSVVGFDFVTENEWQVILADPPQAAAPITADGAPIEHDADGVIPDDDAQVIAQPSNEPSAVLKQTAEEEEDLSIPDFLRRSA